MKDNWWKKPQKKLSSSEDKNPKPFSVEGLVFLRRRENSVKCKQNSNFNNHSHYPRGSVVGREKCSWQKLRKNEVLEKTAKTREDEWRHFFVHSFQRRFNMLERGKSWKYEMQSGHFKEPPIDRIGRQPIKTDVVRTFWTLKAHVMNLMLQFTLWNKTKDTFENAFISIVSPINPNMSSRWYGMNFSKTLNPT